MPPGPDLEVRLTGLMLRILHDLSILLYHNSQGIGYLGSCRIFRIHRRVQSLGFIGFRAEALGFRVYRFQGLGLRVQVSGLRVFCQTLRISVGTFGMQGLEFRGL